MKLKMFIDNFYLIFKSRNENKLYSWIAETKESTFKEIASFSNGLLKDIDAVLERNINRLKMIKRQMYGRVKFDLIKQKVLYQLEN